MTHGKGQLPLFAKRVACAGALLLAGCVPGPPPPASQYHATATVTRVPLVFVTGGIRLSEAEATELHGLRLSLPVQALPALHASGPLAAARTKVVAALLGRQVQLVNAAGMPPDQALLVIDSPAIVADACRGKGVRTLGSIWPGNDDAAPRLLPPGCATALNIEAQTTRPADLLMGRPLPPGAATPFAAAIERYYRRNDPSQSNSNAAPGSSQGTSDQSGSATAQQPAPGVLLGPLPPQAQAAPQAGPQAAH